MGTRLGIFAIAKTRSAEGILTDASIQNWACSMIPVRITIKNPEAMKQYFYKKKLLYGTGKSI